MSLGQMWWTCGQPAEAARLEVFGHRGQRRDLDFPVLYGCSRELVAQPTDWPADHLICGHWSRPVQEWQAPAALLEFLAAGEAPIYAGFGSASRVMRPKVMHALIDAIAGRRTIFGPGWSQVEASGLPRNFFVAGNVPHEWLFPRASMVIHHGGAGTTHTAARAGVPQIILPVGADQYFWASRVAARGAAPAHTIGAALRASTIARMIRDCQQGEMQRCARALGAAMAQEDGIAVAIARIEHSVASAAG
jgi:UDP:flavonoid glycosyltransferase YjiC (YdhE family)